MQSTEYKSAQTRSSFNGYAPDNTYTFPGSTPISQSGEDFRFTNQNASYKSNRRETEQLSTGEVNFSPELMTKSFQNVTFSLEEIEIEHDVPFTTTFIDYASSGESNKTTAFSASFAGNDKPRHPDFPLFGDDSFKVCADFNKTEAKSYRTDGGTNPKLEEKFHWKPALVQSGIFLGIQHGVRLFQKRTYRELGGPFFKDWAHSVRNLRGWADGDIFFINYIAHPLQGAATGRIFVNNSDKAKKHEFGKSRDYWESRMKAMVWSAFWSTQFELGPISEASIGNVGIHDDTGRSRMGWVDLVITPTVGTGTLILEDILDKYVLKNWLEKKLSSRTKIKLFRSLITPTTSFANLLRGKKPWKRDTR